MIEEKKLKQITDKVLKASHAEQTEVLLFVSSRNLTRFANSQIIQNVTWDDVSVSVRAVQGKKVGVAATNLTDAASLERVAEKALVIANAQKEDPDFTALPEPKPIPIIVSAYVESTVNATPEHKASMVKTIIDKAVANNLVASGAFDTVSGQFVVANSLGTWVHDKNTTNKVSTVLLGEDKTGYAAQDDKDITKINPELLADKAIQKATFPKAPIELPEGEYEVVLEPDALGDEFIGYWSWLGPNARVYHEDSSHMSGQIGKKVYSEKITITDDPLTAQGIPMAFDFEGYPKDVLPIVENGVLKNICYDNYLSHKYGHPNTGHAMPAPNTYGAIPMNLVFAPGDKTIEDMIKSVKRGIYVTRFWYIRMLHHKLLNITGMTRDGTFLIENGEFAAPVKNMRFTQSIPDALSDVINVGSELSLQGGWFGANLIPALHLGKFNFTGRTLF